MKALKKSLLAAAFLAITGLGTGAHANIVDLFTEPAASSGNRVTDETLPAGGPVCERGTVSGTGCFNEYGIGANILGGYRDLYVESLAVSDPLISPSTDMRAGGGSLSFSASSGTTGYGKVQWDGLDTSADLAIQGLNGAELIHQTGCDPILGCDRFIADVLVADQAFEYKITVYDMTGNWAVLTADTLFPIASATDAEYLFSWFNLASGNYFLGGLPFNIASSAGLNPGSIDFDNIGALQFEINTNGTIAVDLSLASITKRGAPEPSALALAGVALLGAWVAGRRRKTSGV